MKKILLLIFVALSISSPSKAEFFKFGKLKIELFERDKLIKTRGSINEGFGTAKINVFAEKTSDNNISSIITTVKYKGQKFGTEMRTWWTHYFFKSKKGLFFKNGESNLSLTNEGFTNAIVVQELNLNDYLNQHDDFQEYKSAIKKLKKKHNVDLPERVIRSDHIYIKGGDLFWVGHIFNYDQIINENVFVDKLTKFNPNIIDGYPNYKKKMDQWINLALKRHQEFQDTFKIRKKIKLENINFNINENLKYFKDTFYLSDFISEENLKAKEEKEKKAKLAAEQKAKEEKEKKAKLAAEQKAKEEKEKKDKEEKSKSEDEISVDDLMSKIKELNEMYKSGVISKDEFEMLKKKLLKN